LLSATGAVEARVQVYLVESCGRVVMGGRYIWQ